MQIKTNSSREGDRAPAPEKNRYLRRKPAQKARKSQGEKRRWLKVVRAAALIGALGAAALVLALLLDYAYHSESFALRTITVLGGSRVSTEDLQGTIRESFPAHLLQIDLEKLQARLEEETWVRRAEIQRVLPSELIITIEERTPSVILELGGRLMITDAEGVLLDAYDPNRDRLDMPVFKGALGRTAEDYRHNQGENAIRIQLGLQMIRELEEGSPEFSGSISEVDLSDRSNLKVLLVNETPELHLGDREFLNRFRTFRSNLEQYRQIQSQYESIESIDLRFDGQIIYRPRQGAPARGDEADSAGP